MINLFLTNTECSDSLKGLGVPENRSSSMAVSISTIIASAIVSSTVISSAVVSTSVVLLLLFVSASSGGTNDHVVVGGSPGISADGEVDSELLEEVSNAEVDVSNSDGKRKSSADDVLGPDSLGKDDLTSGNDLGEGVEFGHDFTTEVDGIGEVITESVTLIEILATGRSHEGSDGTGGEDPLEKPDLSLPEVPGEELVGSIDVGL